MIRLATESEALAILNEPQNQQRIGIMAEKTIYQPWIAEQDLHQMLFFFWLLDIGTYEVHIAAPKRSIIRCRALAIELMEWLFRLGASTIRTNCPEGKIANMARKLGMCETHRAGNTVYFEVASWV